MNAESGAGLLTPAYNDDEEQSPEWEKIKDWVGAHEPAKKHPITQMIDREHRKIQAFDEGGSVGGFDVDAGASNTARGGMAPQVPLPPPAAPKPFDMASLPPSVPPMAAPAAAPATPAIVPPAPAVAPTDESYDSEAAKTLGTSPEELRAFLTKTMKPTGGEMIGRAGAAFGEGLSAAGGQPRPYTSDYDKLIQQQKENMAGIPGKVTEQGKQQYALAHELQSYDANSPFSKVTQNANRQLLKTMGATDAQISSMPASAINDVVTHQVDLKKALAEIEQTGEYRRGMLGLQSQAEKTREVEAETQGKEAEKGALEEVTKGSKVPFLGPSHTEKQAAFKKLENLGGLGKQEEGPLGASTVRNGRTYDWSPTTGKYHLRT